MWKTLIRNLCEDCEFSPPAPGDRITQVASALGIGPPGDLRDLLRESDGVDGEFGEGLVWSAARIVEENLSFRGNADFRGLYMPFDHLLFFADAGNGDQFAFPVDADGVIRRPDVFAWKHEDDSRAWVAPLLKAYLERALSGGFES